VNEDNAPGRPGTSTPGTVAVDAQTNYEVGDRLRHRKRPEWGVGTITRIEPVRLGDRADQRLWIRFSNAGSKAVLASIGELDRIAADGDGHTLTEREARHEGGWLGEIARRRPEDAMTELPPEASDRFLPLRKRLDFTLGLYRFEPVGGKLLDWAIAQTGLEDPLARFSRHELEQFFQRWAFHRDQHLGRLVQESRAEPGVLQAATAQAPPAAQRALRKIHAGR
jgi:hypothetical protein